MDKKEKEEYKKCKRSPYYFAIKYLTLNGKPFSTNLTEEEFNNKFRKQWKTIN